MEIGQYAVLERVAGAAQKCPRRSRAPKSFKMSAFQSFSQGFPGVVRPACVSSPRRSGVPKSFKTIRVFGCESWGCSGALISVFSFHARNEEDNDSVWIALGVSFSGDFSFHARNEVDVIVSRVESGQWTVCS